MCDERSPRRPELVEFERQLAALAPCAPLDRDRLMYAAGRHSARRLRSVNRLLSFVSVAFACTTAVLIGQRHGNEVALTAALPAANDARELAPPSAWQTTESMLASVDTATNFRLLRLLDDRGALVTEQRPQTGECGAGEGEVDAGNRDASRVLMNRDLDQAGGHL